MKKALVLSYLKKVDVKFNNYINVFFITVLLFSACSSSESQGVVTLQNQETTTESTVLEDISPEDAQLIIAECLREKGYDIQDPSREEGFRQQMGPENEGDRQQMFEEIRACAEENNLPLFSETQFEDPAVVAARLDDELKMAQCLRENGYEVQDPNTETGLREIIRSLSQTANVDMQEVRTTVENCFDELGLERPEGPGGGSGMGPRG